MVVKKIKIKHKNKKTENNVLQKANSSVNLSKGNFLDWFKKKMR